MGRMRINPSASKFDLARQQIHNDYKARIGAAKLRLAERHKDAQKLIDDAVDEYETERQSAYAIERRELLDAHAQERKADMSPGRGNRKQLPLGRLHKSPLLTKG